ncbi:S1C family serine protease, partial [Frankia nepalensis]
ARPGLLQDGSRRFSARVLVATALVASLVGGVLGGAVYAWVARDDSGASPALPASAQVPVESPGSVADAAERALPSVVTIGARGEPTGAGTGVIIRSDGYILTNSHVLAGALSTNRQIVVTRYQDATQIPARLVGQDAQSDLAVIKIDVAGPLPAATLGRSDSLRVGSQVIAIGTHLGLPGTVTTGIVSALNRSPTEPVAGLNTVLSGAIQTDAAINPGSSGGPLLDALGQVVGINTAIAAVPGDPGGNDGQTGSIGVGFAIPIDQARPIAEHLIQSGGG